MLEDFPTYLPFNAGFYFSAYQQQGLIISIAVFVVLCIMWVIQVDSLSSNQSVKPAAKNHKPVTRTQPHKLQAFANLEKVDINNADLDEIRNIKGINIIIAKRIIKKREEIGGFKSIEDVVIFSRLKSHAAEMLREQIEIKPMKISPAQIRYEREMWICKQGNC